MKIGIVCPYDIFRSGGVQEHVLAQATELRLRGHEVKIITPKPRKFSSKMPADVIFIGNSAMIKTPIKTSLELGISIQNEVIDEMLDEEKFDLLHIHEPEVPIIGIQILAKTQCPVVGTFHAIYPDTPMARTIEAFRIPFSRSVLSRLSLMTAVSDTAASYIRKKTRQQVHIVPNGIDLAKYHLPKAAVTKTPKKQSVLYVGRLEKRKGVECLIRAFAAAYAQDPSVTLIIAGQGPERDRLGDVAKELRLKNIQFLGFVDDDTKIKLLSEARVFCSPALYGESFGIVLLEAMAMGAVTLAGNNPGYVSVMQDQAKLSIVDPKDTKAFKTRLITLMTDETARKAWQKWAKKYVKQFDYKNVIDQYEDIYKELAGARV